MDVRPRHATAIVMPIAGIVMRPLSRFLACCLIISVGWARHLAPMKALLGFADSSVILVVRLWDLRQITILAASIFMQRRLKIRRIFSRRFI